MNSGEDIPHLFASNFLIFSQKFINDTEEADTNDSDTIA